MVNNLKISVIIPVHNTELYLVQCLESVINQTYSNWEIIICDDLSTDKSSQICKSYKESYPNKIKLFSTTIERYGVSNARNICLENSTGDYIVFLDSDDYLLSNKLFEYINFSNNKNIDCFIGSYNSFTESKNIEPLYLNTIDNSEINYKSHCDVLEYIYLKRLIFTSWRFIVKRKIIIDNNLFFEKNIIHEDEEWCVRLLLACETYEAIPFIHYNYRKRSNSIMSSRFNYNHEKNYLKVVDLILNTALVQKEEYKKIFALRCAYKCAGQVYYGLRNISNYKPPIGDNYNIEEHKKIYSNILVFGTSRSGKTYLAKLICKNKNFTYVSLDKLITAFQNGMPELKINHMIRDNDMVKKFEKFLFPYLSSMSHLSTDMVLPMNIVVEGSYLDLEDFINSKLYNRFKLIILVQNEPAKDIFNDLKKYDREHDWTYSLKDDELYEYSENIEHNAKQIIALCEKYNLEYLDTSKNRKAIFDDLLKKI